MSGPASPHRSHYRRHSKPFAVQPTLPQRTINYTLAKAEAANANQDCKAPPPPIRLLRVPARFTPPKTAARTSIMAASTKLRERENEPSLDDSGNNRSYQLPNGNFYHQYDRAQTRQCQSTADFVTRTERSSARSKQEILVGRNPQVDPASPLVDEQMPRPTLHNPPSVPRRMSPGSAAKGTTDATTPTNRDIRMPLSSRRPSFDAAATSPIGTPRQAPSTAWTTPVGGSPIVSPCWDGGFTGYGSARNSWEVQMHQGHPWHRPTPIKRLPRREKGELFSFLPGEVLELIMEELKQSHLGPGSGSCATCWMRDACNAAVSCRKWHKYARAAL